MLKSRRGPLFKFLVVFLSIFIPIGLVLTAGVWAYSRIFGNANLDQAQMQARHEIERMLTLPGLVPDDETEIIGGIPSRTNFLLMGIDWDGQSSRSDTMMIGSFDIASNELSIISVPRDMRITLSERTRAILPSIDDADLPWHSVRYGIPNNMRINAIWHNFGPIHGPTFLINQLQEMLGIRIHYWVSVELEGFKRIIDAVDGVYFNVPQRMFFVYPPDGPDAFGIQFRIDLHPGRQLLTGQQALDVVRYRATSDETIARGYARGDLQRIEVQQDFLNYVIPQLLSRDNIVRNIFSYIDIIADHVQMNIELNDVLRYASHILGMNFSELTINTYTLPHTEGSRGYVHLDPVPSHELVQRVFYGNIADEAINGDNEATNGSNE